jgi:anti-sigma B factor antagonist
MVVVAEHSELAKRHVSAISGDRITVAIVGELDMSNAEILLAWIGEAAAQYPDAVVELDMAEVEYMDSAGVRSLLRAHRQLREAGRVLRLTQASELVSGVLSTTGVLSILIGQPGA